MLLFRKDLELVALQTSIREAQEQDQTNIDRKIEMHSKPDILPLNPEGTIYALQDELGKTIGTGSREVCELLLHVLNKQATERRPEDVLARIEKERTTPHPNVRSAIAI